MAAGVFVQESFALSENMEVVGLKQLEDEFDMHLTDFDTIEAMESRLHNMMKLPLSALAFFLWDHRHMVSNFARQVMKEADMFCCIVHFFHVVHILDAATFRSSVGDFRQQVMNGLAALCHSVKPCDHPWRYFGEVAEYASPSTLRCSGVPPFIKA